MLGSINPGIIPDLCYKHGTTANIKDDKIRNEIDGVTGVKFVRRGLGSDREVI